MAHVTVRMCMCSAINENRKWGRDDMGGLVSILVPMSVRGQKTPEDPELQELYICICLNKLLV